MKKTKIQTVIEALGLKDASKLVNVGDGSILRIPGIGLGSLAEIRRDFPFDDENEKKLKDLRIQLSDAKRRLDDLGDGEIDLGSVENVIAVRYFPGFGKIAIKTSIHEELFLIHFGIYPCDETLRSDFGFGEITMEEPVPLGVALPMLTAGCNRCWLEHRWKSDDGRQCRILFIESGIRIFRVALLLDKSVHDL